MRRLQPINAFPELATPIKPVSPSGPAPKKMPVPSEAATLNKTKELQKFTNPREPGTHIPAPPRRHQQQFQRVMRESTFVIALDNNTLIFHNGYRAANQQLEAFLL